MKSMIEPNTPPPLSCLSSDTPQSPSFAASFWASYQARAVSVAEEPVSRAASSSVYSDIFPSLPKRTCQHATTQANICQFSVPITMITMGIFANCKDIARTVLVSRVSSKYPTPNGAPLLSRRGWLVGRWLIFNSQCLMDFMTNPPRGVSGELIIFLRIIFFDCFLESSFSDFN